VAAYKYPRRVEILEALPLGPSGKVLKRELVARFEAEGIVVDEAEEESRPVG
jgi:long-chain acyl-CoA synthetase